jgi:PST family polysaccharide transporter
MHAPRKKAPSFRTKKGEVLIRQVAKANTILLVQYGVGSLVPLLLIPHIVHVIGLEEYGRIAVLMVWGGYGAAVVQYAFQLTGPKRVMQLAAGESIESVFIDIAVAKLLLLLLVITALVIVALLSTPFESKSSIAWALLLAGPIAAGLNSTWFLQSQGNFSWVAFLAIIGSLFTLYLGFNYVTDDNRLAIDFAVIVSIFGALFLGLGTLVLSIFSMGKTSYKWSILRAIEAVKEGWHLFISQFISILYSGAGTIVINFFLDSKAAGSYSVMERIIGALMSAALLTHTAAYPRLASAYISNRFEYFRMVKLIIFVYVGVTSVIAFLLWLFREAIVNYLYNEINSDYYLLLYFGLAWLVLGIFGTTLTGYLTVSGKSREVWPLTLKILISSILLGIIGIFTIGNAGWLAGLVISQLIVLHAGYIYWRKDFAK